MLSASIETSGRPQQVTKQKSSSRKVAPEADSGRSKVRSQGSTSDPRVRAYGANLIAKYDKNDDKALDAEERSQISMDCSGADTDKDGLVTAEELGVWLMKLRR